MSGKIEVVVGEVEDGGGSELVNILCWPLLLEIVLLIMTGGGH